jgi:hydrogenase/urease accessory protein HupE
MIRATFGSRRCVVRWLILLAGLLCLPLAAPALAHPAPFSYLDLQLKDDRIEGALTVHATDVARMLGTDDPDHLLEPGIAAALGRQIAAKIEPGLQVSGDAPLQPHWTEFRPSASDSDALVARFVIDGPPPARLQVATNLFTHDPAHQTFVSLHEGGRLRQQWILSGSARPATYYLGTAAGVASVIATFVPSGIHHILIGPDHILFVIALLLLGGGFWHLVRVVTAFTIGHSITLALAVLDIVILPPAVIEPLIALSIVVVGADNILRKEGRDLRAAVALLFGLIHGFGFASVLRDFGLPQEALGWALFSFNVGVELGQLAIVVPVALAINAIRRKSAIWGRRVAVVGSAVVIAAGGFWFVERVISLGGY